MDTSLDWLVKEVERLRQEVKKIQREKLWQDRKIHDLENEIRDIERRTQ